MTIKHAHEDGVGHRFSKDDVSLILHFYMKFKREAGVANLDLYQLFKATNQLLADLGTYDNEGQTLNEPLRRHSFANLKDVSFYKFIPASVVDYYQSGSLQLGSIQYYRDIENQNSKDRMEGLSNILFHGKDRYAMSLASGYNFGIFCGTSTRDHSAKMSKQFGAKLIKIVDLPAFAEEVRAILKAKRYYFNHVKYSDLKLFRVRTMKKLDFAVDDPSRDFDPSKVTDAIFDLLYKESFLPSLFMKPTRFSGENELRLVFEMPHDVPHPRVLKFTDPALVKYIEFVDIDQ